MPEAELDPTVIKRTQEILGKYVKKPPLTEKLLKKPPFRFLHDVFKVVMKDTGAFDGLYTADELNFENIKDRDDKMRFLQKMIDVVKLTTKRELNVRTSKIVAGYEPERTNELLQLMGEIVEEKLDWKTAVKTVVSNAGSAANGGVNGIEKEKEKEKDKAKEKVTSVVKKKENTKNDEKVREKLKEKSSQKLTKETTKAMGGSKGSKNTTPSPDEKLKKSSKPVTKEKTLSRQATVEKVVKEANERGKTIKKSKEKAKEKEKETSKTIKTKEDVKRGSPSPVKPSVAIKTAQQQPLSVDANLKQHENIKPLEIELENGVENGGDFMDPTRRGSSKQLEMEDQTAIENGNGNGNDSRKSSAKQTRKSASRRSSASKTSPINQQQETHEQNQTTQNMDSLKSLKTVNEEGGTATAAVVAAAAGASNQPMMQPVQPTKEIRREPTFTHENSKDSVGSNSNSSTTRPRTSLRPPSARPPSARPGAPRRRDKNVEIILQPNDQVKMSNVNVKLETFGDFDDDGENLVIIEDATTTENFNERERSSKLEADKLEQQGHLVQQILETQKELVQQNGEIGGIEKDPVETGFDSKSRQSSARQMNNLRDIIQSLTKSVNPFGKLMDFIPEDIDAMQLELNMWRDTYSQAASDLKREKGLTESATEPMKNQLIQIEANIKEYTEMNDASRVKILQNSEKILKMLLEQ